MMIDITSGADISADGQYRYHLWRRWVDANTASKWMAFVMLNPSTADASIDDPTIRRCISFARREDCNGIVVVNLFAYRATNPDELDYVVDPVGPENDRFISDLLVDASHTDVTIVAAWGTKGRSDRVRFIQSEAAEHGVDLHCLGRTKAGHPRHPLYVRGDTPLEKWGAR